MLGHNCHRTLLPGDIRWDIERWSRCLEIFNGKSLLLDRKPIECVFTDACDAAAGGSFGKDWFYFNWSLDWPLARHFHINEKEVVAEVLAAHRWADKWKNKWIIMYSDNTVTVSSINEDSSRNHHIIKCLRSLF